MLAIQKSTRAPELTVLSLELLGPTACIQHSCGCGVPAVFVFWKKDRIMLRDIAGSRWRALWPALVLLTGTIAVVAAVLYISGAGTGGRATLATGLSKTVSVVLGGLHFVRKALNGTAAGIYFAAATLDHTLFRIYLRLEGPLLEAEKALGMDTWSIAAHDTFLGGVFCLGFILVRHHSVLWNRGLPALTEFISDYWIWPGPLRRRRTRNIFFKGCRDILCAVLGLTALVLLLTNSAAKPDPSSDKWFSASSPSSPLTRVTPKQPSSMHHVSQQSAPHQQLQAYSVTAAEGKAATCPSQSFAERCLLWMRQPMKQDPQQSQPTAVIVPSSAPAIVTPCVKAPAATSLPTTPLSSTALMRAPSRALVLVPSLSVCPAAFPNQAWTFQAQYTLTVRPFLPMFLKPHGQASAHTQDSCSKTTSPVADAAVARPVSDVGCNGTFMCCVVGSLSQPQSPTSTAHAASTFAAVSHLLKHVASLHADFLPDLRSWSWSQTLLFGSFMFSLGIIIPGLQVWCRCGGVTPAVGAAIAPAKHEDPMSLKLERAGKKAGRVLKRTTTSLISTRWTGDHVTTPSLPPSPAPPSVQQGQHSLVDADSILAHEVPNLRAAAERDQSTVSTSEAPLPTQPPEPVSCVMAPGLSGAALPAQPTDNAEPQAAANDDPHTAANAPPDEAAPTAQPGMIAQPAAAVQPAPAAHQAPPAPQPPTAQPHAPVNPVAPAMALPAANEPAASAQLHLPSAEPAELISAAPSLAQPAAHDKPDSVIEPTRVQTLANSSPQAAVVSQAALLQAIPEASMPSHNLVAAEGSIGEVSQDKVVSSGCWGALCCFKSGRKARGGTSGRR